MVSLRPQGRRIPAPLLDTAGGASREPGWRYEYAPRRCLSIGKVRRGRFQNMRRTGASAKARDADVPDWDNRPVAEHDQFGHARRAACSTTSPPHATGLSGENFNDETPRNLRRNRGPASAVHRARSSCAGCVGMGRAAPRAGHVPLSRAQRSATPTSTVNRSDTVANSAQDHPYCDASRHPAFQFFRICLPCVLCVFAVKGLR